MTRRSLGGTAASFSMRRNGYVEVVEAVREKGFRMRDADVVPLEEALENDLPVGLRHARARVVDLLTLADELRQTRELCLNAARTLRNEDQTMALDHLQRRETVLLLVQPRKAFGMRDVSQPSIQLVCPPVIRADECLGTAAVGRDAHAAVAADIVKRPHDAILAADRDDRRAGRFASDEGSDFGERCRRTERSVRAPQHPFHLGVEALLRAIVFHRFAPQLIAGIGAPVGDV
jgi:hypothetical protein